jgi:hypothetical protein
MPYEYADSSANCYIRATMEPIYGGRYVSLAVEVLPGIGFAVDCANWVGAVANELGSYQ